MINNPMIIKDSIVGALLKLADHVLEVNTLKALLHRWDKVQPDPDLYTEIDIKCIINACGKAIDSAHRRGNPAPIEYLSPTLPDDTLFLLRVISNQFNLDSVFILVEKKTISKPVFTHLGMSEMVRGLEEMGFVTWQIDTSTNQIRFSEKWYPMFGYEKGDIQTSTDWAGKIHPDDLPVVIENRRKYLTSKNNIFIIEIRYQCKDGSWKWVRTRSVMTESARDGKPLRYFTACADINDKKKIEIARIEHEQFLLNLVNNLFHGVLVVDREGKIILANQNFSRKYEDDEDLYLKGKNFWERIEFAKQHYKDPAAFLQRVQEITAKKEKVVDETLELSDGRTFKRDYFPLFNEQNKFTGEIWLFRDITKQQKTENRLNEQRFFYESILNNIPACVAVIDRDNHYVFLNNQTFEDGALRQLMLGKTDLEYCRFTNTPEEYCRKRWELYQRVRKEKSEVRTIEETTNGQGESMFYLRILNPVINRKGDVEFIVFYSVDVTELIKAQETLKTSMETFSGAFNHSGVGMAIIAPDGYYLDVNDTVCQMSGYTKEELCKLHHKDITFPEDREIEDTLINQLLRREIDTFTIEKRFVTKDNRIVLALLNATLVWNRDNTPKFYVVHVLDVTEKKHLENELHKQNQSLETARNSLLNKINQLEEFNRIVAHNLRGPARNIEMLVDVLQTKLDSKSKPEADDLSDAFSVDETLELIDKSSAALLGSLNTLMEITQIKLNKEIPYDDCDFNEIIDSVVKQLYTHIFEKNALIKRDIKLPRIDYPRAYLESILFNLISNALKYSRPGVRPEITISTSLKDNSKRLVVADNGLGIDLEKYGRKVFMLNQIFHKGFDSKGIGLYITKTQIESQGGTIKVNSEVNRGSEFTVTFK